LLSKAPEIFDMKTVRTDIWYLGKSITRNRNIILNMTRRNLIMRYKGSLLGVFWSFLNPLLMLAVYAFMFLFVFQAKWGANSINGNHVAFVPVLFTGLIVHGFFAEVITSAPNLITNNVNFVKKVVFPLEVLSIVSVATALINCLTAWVILICMQTFLGGEMHVTLLFFPLVMIPLVLLALAMSWILAAIGVFVRDIAQIVGFVATAALFLSPIFFPISALPGGLQPWMHLNPLTLIVEQAREVIITGSYPDIWALTVYLLVAAVLAAIGFAGFQKMRKGFADVL
jgi:lipopolysaccharide transport system permease protein